MQNSSFPSSLASALAMIYVDKNAEAGMSPQELLSIYNKAFNEINNLIKAERQEKLKDWI